jgi:hypothetical protein
MIVRTGSNIVSLQMVHVVIDDALMMIIMLPMEMLNGIDEMVL